MTIHEPVMLKKGDTIRLLDSSPGEWTAGEFGRLVEDAKLIALCDTQIVFEKLGPAADGAELYTVGEAVEQVSGVWYVEGALYTDMNAGESGHLTDVDVMVVAATREEAQGAAWQAVEDHPYFDERLHPILSITHVEPL